MKNEDLRLRPHDMQARVLVPVCKVVGFLLPGRQLDRQTDSKHFLHEANHYSFFAFSPSGGICSSPGAAVLYLWLFMVFSWVCCSCFISASVVHLTNCVAFIWLVVLLGLLFFTWGCTSLPRLFHGLFLVIFCCFLPGFFCSFGIDVLYVGPLFFTYPCCSSPVAALLS
jgi:hypothetical protein